MVGSWWRERVRCMWVPVEKGRCVYGVCTGVCMGWRALRVRVGDCVRRFDRSHFHRRAQHGRLDLRVERRVTRERGRVVDLEQLGAQLVVHHDVEAEQLEAAEARVLRPLPCCEVRVLEMRLHL